MGRASAMTAKIIIEFMALKIKSRPIEMYRVV